MTKRWTILAALLAAFCAPPAPAQPAPPPGQPPAPPPQSVQRSFTQAELDRLLAPIALYPDALLSQVLMASTYPVEVVEAARWIRDHPGLQGDAAVRAAAGEDWDPSVKSLVAFPQVLQRMDEQLQWTRSLGDAFLGQERAVMATVQGLRRRAQAVGTLRPDAQIDVVQQGELIYLEPASPQVVYVPYYDPWTVYGAWWWPEPPVVWAPWPGYARTGLAAGFWWGAPVSVSATFFFGRADWRRREVRVVNVNNDYYRPPLVVSRAGGDRGHWQHDPSHRHADYRQPEVRERYAAYQPRRVPELRREEARHPEERHQVLSAPPARKQTPAPTRAPEAKRPPAPHPKHEGQDKERGHKGGERS